MEAAPPIEIPSSSLSNESLAGIIDNFILREGTDYGSKEQDHAAKVARIERQLARREVVIVFDPETESVSLVTEVEWRRRQSEG